MALKISLQQNDNGIKLFFTIKKDGIVQDITDCVIRVKFKNPVTNEEFIKIADVIDAENGQASCVLFKKDLSQTGTYQTEVETTYPSGVRLSEKNPFLPVINEEIFSISQDIIDDFPNYKDENLK